MRLKNIKNKYWIVTLLFCIVTFILYFFLSIHDNLWYDEAYQMILNRNSFADIIYYTGRDFSPPFYAILLKIVTMMFGSSLFVGRMVSLSAVFGLIWLSFYPIRKVFNEKVSFLFALFLLTTQFLFYAAIEIRTYSWSMFFTLACVVYMLMILKENKTSNWILYTIFAILGMYSHNYSILCIFITNALFLIYIIFKRRDLFWNYLIARILIFIAFLPWINVLLQQINAVSTKFWIPRPNQNTFYNSVDFMIYNNVIVKATIVIGIIVGIWNLIKTEKPVLKKSFILIIPSVLTLFLFIWSSCFKTPLFIPRYIVPVSGALLLFVAIMFRAVKSKLLMAILLVVWTIPTFDIYRMEYYKTDDRTVYQIKEWVNKLDEKPVFLQYYEFHLGITSYYFPKAINICHEKTDTVLTTFDAFGDSVIQIQDPLDVKKRTNRFFVVNINFDNKTQLVKDGWEVAAEQNFFNPYFGRYSLTYFKYVG